MSTENVYSTSFALQSMHDINIELVFVLFCFCFVKTLRKEAMHGTVDHFCPRRRTQVCSGIIQVIR